jgi:hypothetical protein
MTKIFETPEEVAGYLRSGGTGMPPSYSGVGEYLRNGDFGGPIIEGALLALDGDNDAARSEAIVLMQGVSGGLVLERSKEILEHQPLWWADMDPHRGGTFGDRFLQMMTYGEIPRDKVLSEKLLELSKGTNVEGEVERSILAWRR